MSFPAWLLFLGHFLSVCYQEVSGVVVESDNLHVQELEFGETILSCKYKLDRDQVHRLEWKKVSFTGEVSIVYFNNSLAANLQKRVEMIGASLRFKNLTRGDAGKYRCEVSAPQDRRNFQEITITLTVLVAPSVPMCDIPSTAMSGTAVELKCWEKQANPSPEYRWFKNGVLIDSNYIKSVNATYKVNKATGSLHFNAVTKQDTGEYYCEASNNIGKPQTCTAKKMQVDDLNLAGIISAVVIVALAILLCGCGICYAQRKGYFSGSKSSEKENASKSASPTESDFKHTKSFVI